MSLHPLRRQLRADLVLLLVTAIWGTTFVMVKDAVASTPVFTFLAIRFGLAVAATLPLLACWGRSSQLTAIARFGIMALEMQCNEGEA